MTEVFGHDSMYWHRLERSLGRSSLVGTTITEAKRLPRHLVADEKHTTLAGEKVYLAATAGGGCCLGIALAKTAGNDDLTKAYGVFRQEARHLDPEYRPETVNTDGWQATQAAWRSLFQGVTLILCFLHAFLKVRERAIHLKETFAVLRERIWEAYHAPDARSFSQRLRRLREWAKAHVEKEVVLEKVLALCGKRGAFVRAYAHPGCHRTSNPVDRLLRRLDYRLYCTQHLHGTTEAAEQGLRGWALIHNFAPSCPETVRESPGLRSPAERLNGKRYHPEWLQNLLISASTASRMACSSPSISACFSGDTGAVGMDGLRFRGRVFLSGHRFPSCVQKFLLVTDFGDRARCSGEPGGGSAMLRATDLVLVSPPLGGRHASGPVLGRTRPGPEDHLPPVLSGAV
ncbi:MAG TPA: hypothetical protein VFE93_05475 [Myxococcaceae bacterium]|nr:hypothetical protein [Myxococcaceae bacterium]